MNRPFDVAVFVGSLRKEALSRKTANALIALAPPSLRLATVEIALLPLYIDRRRRDRRRLEAMRAADAAQDEAARRSARRSAQRSTAATWRRPRERAPRGSRPTCSRRSRPCWRNRC